MRLNADINVVSLIDVMLLLLVIFMLVAPMMTGGLDLTLPSADAKPLETKSGLTVAIDRAGSVYVNDSKMTMAQFTSTFRLLARGKEGVNVSIDKSRPYEDVAQVLSVIRAAGIVDIGLVFESQDIVK